MTKVLVVSEVESWSTRGRDPNDEWDQGDSAGHVSNVYAKLPKEDDDYYYSGDSLTKNFEENLRPGIMLYAVVADYESGSTFGRSGGYAQVLDVFLDKADADALASRAVVSVDGGDRYSFTWRGKEYFRSWEGYFERLQSLDVWECAIRGGATLRADSPVGYKRGQ